MSKLIGEEKYIFSVESAKEILFMIKDAARQESIALYLIKDITSKRTEMSDANKMRSIENIFTALEEIIDSRLI